MISPIMTDVTGACASDTALSDTLTFCSSSDVDIVFFFSLMITKFKDSIIISINKTAMVRKYVQQRLAPLVKIPRSRRPRPYDDLQIHKRYLVSPARALKALSPDNEGADAAASPLARRRMAKK